MIAFLFVAALAAQTPPDDGAKAMREGRFADAERIYRQMIRETPGEPRLRMNLGLALHSGGKYSEALAEFDAFLKANPKPGPAHLLAGVALLKLGRPCDAIARLEPARQWQSNAMVLTELADAYAGCKRHRNAALTYREVAKLKPGDTAVQRAAAHSFWLARDYQEAQPLYAALESKFTRDAAFLFEYGDTLARAQGAETGVAHLRRAVALGPEQVAARGALGRVLMELGQAAESIPHLEAAVASDPALLLPLSRAYKQTGRMEEGAKAEAEYRRRMGGR